MCIRDRSTGDSTAAENRARRALGEAEDMGALALLAQSHHLLAESLRSLGRDADAERHAVKAAEYLEEIREDAATDAVFERSDLEAIAEASAR